jgi:hypothetical protein
MRTALAFLDAQAAVNGTKNPPPAVSAAPTTVTASTTPPAASSTINLDVRLDTIAFGPNQSAQKVLIGGRIENGWPASVTFKAVSNTGHPLSAVLTPDTPGVQKLQVNIGDSIAWVRTLTAPWHDVPPPPGQFGTLVTQVIKIPSLLAGGDVTVDAEWHRNEPEWLQARVNVNHATVVRPPFVLQALAFKFGKKMQTSPLIEQLTINHLTLGPTYIDIADTTLVGSGFINNLTVKTGHHDWVSNQVASLGTYFGIGYELSGTLAKPFIGLPDSNKLIKAIGTENEFDFFGDNDQPEKPAAKQPDKPAPKKP